MALTLDATYGNLVVGQPERMNDASDIFMDDHSPGCTEPWIVEVLCALLKATGVGEPTVLETGGFRGTTTEWLARTIKRMGGGKLIVAELDPVRADLIHDRLNGLPLEGVSWKVWGQDATTVIAALPDGSLTFAFVDDGHDMDHVTRETDLLLPKMAAGGIICFHDVFGSCDLQRVVRGYGGYCLDFPRLGPAGGLGIIQT